MPAGFTVTVAAIIGALVGSFLNVIILRVPKGQPVMGVRNRSRCPRCKHVLHALDLVPVFSYLALRGRCRYCRKPISSQYAIVEVLTAITFAVSMALFDVSLTWLLVVVAASWFIALGFIDGKHGIVPDQVSLTGIAVVAVLQVVRVWHSSTSFAPGAIFRSLGVYVLAALLGAGWFAVQWAVSRGRWVGSGDIRLGALMGILLGLPHLLIALFLAYVVGSAWAVVLLLRKRVHLQSAIPFGTFLAIATIITSLFGTSVVSWYQQLLGW